MQEDLSAEVARKVANVAALARDLGLGGIVLAASHNFAWLTAGRSNRVDITRETGSAMLAIGADGRRFALANAIERPRAESETLGGLGFEFLEYPWTDERGEPALPYRVAATALGTDALGTDIPNPHARSVEAMVARLRATLDPDELQRYRVLGAECGQVVATILRHSPPGSSEDHVASRLGGAFLSVGITPQVVLVGADDRISRFRHPVPTNLRWRHRLLVAVCAERAGQVVALTRMVSNGLDDDLATRVRGASRVLAALFERTQPGTTGAELYRAACAAYEAAGFAGEERRHHQGGAIGYRSREWIAHPASTDVVAPPQAFAWNPTITGAKLEETCIVHEDGRLEVVTRCLGWPTLNVSARGQAIDVADVLVLRA